MGTKICRKCRVEKNSSSFRRRSGGYLCSWCMECHKEYGRRHYAENRIDIRKTQNAKYYEDIIIPEKKKQILNRTRKAAYRWKENNKDKIREHKKRKRRIDVQYKLSVSLRIRMHEAIRNHQKSGSAVRDLGISIDGFKKYVESKFAPGMSWDNWGLGENKWHLDHIIPLSSVNLSDRDDFLRVCHYTNIQPMWQKDNLAKGKRVPEVASAGK